MPMRTIRMLFVLLLIVVTSAAAEPVERIQDAGFTGGLVAQVGSADLGLRDLGERFHVRLLLREEAAVEEAAEAIDAAGLQGQFTVAAWDGGSLPFVGRALNALVLAEEGLVSREEARRALAPRGLLVTPEGAEAMPVPDAIDDWTHYLYDSAGNAVSKDREVGPPKSFRWWAPPLHMRGHNWGNSFLGLVTGGGRAFYLLDEGPYMFSDGQMPDTGIAERWSLVARDAFNGALLWKKPLKGYGYPVFEDVGLQPNQEFVWRSPLSLNRRAAVVQGDRVYASLAYRQGPLSILDAATGETLHEVSLEGSVDELVADGDLVVTRVRTKIPMPSEFFTQKGAMRAEEQKLKQQGLDHHEVRAELHSRMLEILLEQPLERVMAVDGASGQILWSHDAPLVAHQSLALADGRVLYHNYQSLVALDAETGEPAWKFPNPVQNRRRLGSRALLGALLVENGKVLWASSACGGGYCLNLEDGELLWKDWALATPGGFGFPTGLRVIDGIIYGDSVRRPRRLADGSEAPPPDIAGMLGRGHHIRCFAGKATERFLITPHRGAEFIDLEGDQHMVNDWIRGACGMGNLPANGMFYVSPDPCACYAGAKIIGFHALSDDLPQGLAHAPAPEDPSRLQKGPAYSDPVGEVEEAAWRAYRADARRTGMAAAPMSAELQVLWSKELADPAPEGYNRTGHLTQATAAGGRLYIVKKDTYELLSLDAADGTVLWRRSFPGALDGPPTIVGDRLFIGCRSGEVYSLRASDGAPAWRFRAAPLDRLSLSDDRVESVWPVFSSVIYENGLIYAVAGRNSYLDGGVRLYALDPATGAVRHHTTLEGPWPTEEELREPVITERDLRAAKDQKTRNKLQELVSMQYATGYSMKGGAADLLVSDGEDLYMAQNKFTPRLHRVDLKREGHIGLTPMGGIHMMASDGFQDPTMYHRNYWLYDDRWMGKCGGSGTAARGGTMLAVGADRVYAAKHYEGGWYPSHQPGSGNLVLADAFDTPNVRGDRIDREAQQAKGLRNWGNASDYMRTDKPIWQNNVPILVRAMLAAPDGQGGEIVFSAGVVEGKNPEEWERGAEFASQAKLLVHNGADGRLLAEYDLPACPVFDGLSAAEGRLIVPMLNGKVICLGPADAVE